MFFSVLLPVSSTQSSRNDALPLALLACWRKLFEFEAEETKHLACPLAAVVHWIHCTRTRLNSPLEWLGPAKWQEVNQVCQSSLGESLQGLTHKASSLTTKTHSWSAQLQEADVIGKCGKWAIVVFTSQTLWISHCGSMRFLDSVEDKHSSATHPQHVEHLWPFRKNNLLWWCQKKSCNAFGWKKPAHQCKQSWVAIWNSGEYSLIRPMHHNRYRVEPRTQMCHDPDRRSGKMVISCHLNWRSLQWVYCPGPELRLRLLSLLSRYRNGTPRKCCCQKQNCFQT